jgi:hyperosmotically inducible protein
MKLSFIAIMAALLISVAGCDTGRTMTDATVTAAVKNKLAAEAATSATRINVETANGVVTLSGSVPTAAEKAEAERLTRATQGVTQVVNNITVDAGAAGTPETTGTPGEETGPRAALSDATILTTIKSQLVASGIIGTNVDVKNGEVTIRGTVDNAQEKARVEEIARRASGVKSVNNQLTIKQR